jgi:X-Pro dipeptidyl-peptidase
VHQEVGAMPAPRTSQPAIKFQATRDNVSGSEVSTWVPRGFAVVHSDAPGTGLSQGCPTVGDDPEQLAPKAIIDWLNGRAKGYTTIDGTTEVRATSWATGKVGMTGTSYNGTIPVAAAVTGVAGLEAIIPIAPNTSYYHYYRSNGLIRHPGGWLGEDIDFLYDFINSGDPAKRDYCNKTYRDGLFARERHRENGDYNDFWEARDLLTKVKNIKAAVLMAHAFNEWNVVPEHSVRIYEALKGRVPLQAYYHQGGHGGAPPLEMMNRWFTRYLYGVQNGVETMPKAWIVREGAPAPPPPADGAGNAGGGRGRGATPPPTPYADYPNPEAAAVWLYLASGGASHRPRRGAVEAGQQTLVDNVEISGAQLAGAEVTEPSPICDPELTTRACRASTITLRLVEQAGRESFCGWWCCQDRWPDQPGEPDHARLGRSRTTRHSPKAATTTRSSRRTRARSFLHSRSASSRRPDLPAGKRVRLMIMSSDQGLTLAPKPGTG